MKNLKNAKTLSKKEQKTINGGTNTNEKRCRKHDDCPQGWCCNNRITGACEIGPNCK